MTTVFTMIHEAKLSTNFVIQLRATANRTNFCCLLFHGPIPIPDTIYNKKRGNLI